MYIFTKVPENMGQLVRSLWATSYCSPSAWIFSRIHISEVRKHQYAVLPCCHHCGMENSQIIWYWVLKEYLLSGRVASLCATLSSLSKAKALRAYKNTFYGWAKPHESCCKIRGFTTTTSLGIQYTKHLIRQTLVLCCGL